MRIEPKAAFYNEETGAVQPWKDIEVTDSVGNALVSEGLAIAIAEGGGGGGDTGTVWHVTVNSVPMANTFLTADRIEREAAVGGTCLDVIPFYNDAPFYGVNLPVDDGLTNVEIDFHVYDGYTGAAPVIIKVYYDASYTAEVTGNIAVTHDEYDFIFTVTGDGTITLTAA